MTGAVSHISSRAVQVIIGVDTHKDQHVAVALDGRGVRLDEKHVPVATCGYEELERWSRDLGQVHAFGVEGTGSYGAGLARFLTDREAIRSSRSIDPTDSVRYRKGKSDPTDAEMAARSVLAGIANATPKSGEGEVEMIRMLKSAKNSAVIARTQAVNQMKALVLTAPAGLREALDDLSTSALVKRCRSFRPGRPEQSHDSSQVRTPFACLSPPSTQHGSPGLEGRARTAYPRSYGASAGRSVWSRTRHGCGPADRRRQQSRSTSLRGGLRIAMRGESCTGIIRQDQPASSQPRWRPPGQRGALSHRCGQVALRSAYPGIYASSHRRGNE